MSRVTHKQAKPLVGRQVYALRKDGSVVSGKLVQIRGNVLVLQQPKGKKVQTKAILPLVLFDVLAIGTTPFWGFGGGWGYGFGGWW
ncbi:hypothetical protein [Cohnella sp. REN36]|uniref:hypothetical protein n=1 Tax=Cohnella sp. REN36 TaxID=2887347 RepID=UPI001D1329CC|nr:hypothetical protein [Cohnella sp. REN36]MCC3374974.1 hypothetical protein [Cohnella sp. REN36]